MFKNLAEIITPSINKVVEFAKRVPGDPDTFRVIRNSLNIVLDAVLWFHDLKWMIESAWRSRLFIVFYLNLLFKSVIGCFWFCVSMHSDSERACMYVQCMLLLVLRFPAVESGRPTGAHKKRFLWDLVDANDSSLQLQRKLRSLCRRKHRPSDGTGANLWSASWYLTSMVFSLVFRYRWIIFDTMEPMWNVLSVPYLWLGLCALIRLSALPIVVVFLILSMDDLCKHLDENCVVTFCLFCSISVYCAHPVARDRMACLIFWRLANVML